MVNLVVALASALGQDWRDVGSSMPDMRLNVTRFPSESHLKFGLRSAMALLRASKHKVPAMHHDVCHASQTRIPHMQSHHLETVVQQCRCWARVVKAYIACPSVFEQQVNSGTIHAPDMPKPVSAPEEPQPLFVVLSE